MANSKSAEAVIKFRERNKVKRVEIVFRPEEYEAIKAAADAVGEPVSAYIKAAAKMRSGEK